MNPYEILGIEATASTARVRAAYRLRAKKAHPDAGGSPEKFARLKLAQDVLIDPVRRAKYDATGEIDETAVDNSHAAVYQILSMLLGQILVHDADPLQTDLLEAMRNAVKKQIGDSRQSMKQAERALRRIEALKDRFVRQKSEGVDPIATVLHAHVGSFKHHLEQFKAQLGAHQRALKLLDEYAFTMPAAQMTIMHVLGMMQSNTTGTSATR